MIGKIKNSIILNTLNFLLVSSVVLLTSCNSAEENVEPGKSELVSHDDKSLPFDQRLKKFIEGSLDIPTSENYSIEIFEEHLNDDDVKDMIITVNRLEFAIDQVKASNLTVKAAQIGFFGTHNYFIFYSSKTDSFTSPIVAASTPQRKLKVSFVNLSSPKYKDVQIDYAIRNSQFRRVYLMLDDKPIYAFQWKLYDGWGTDKLEAYCFDYGPGYNSPVKDILIMKADMKNISETDNYDIIEPEITCTKELVKRFFFNEADRKYYTPN